jgi:hypothetical protein
MRLLWPKEGEEAAAAVLGREPQEPGAVLVASAPRLEQAERLLAGEPLRARSAAVHRRDQSVAEPRMPAQRPRRREQRQKLVRLARQGRPLPAEEMSAVRMLRSVRAIRHLRRRVVQIPSRSRKAL